MDNSTGRSHEEDIYEDLCYVTLRVGASPSVQSWSTVPAEKRDFCIKELVETEKNYIEALNMILRHFFRPLKNVLGYHDRRTIFLHVKELAEVHTGFHSELFKACSSTQNKISNCFIHWKEKFVLYGEYCTNLPRAQELVDELCTKNELVNQAVIRCQTEANDGKFRLRDLLSLPMQRILKYHLLLNELIKSTAETHDDYNGLKKAYESMVDLGQYINEVKRDSETLQIIDDIQQSITDLDMPHNTELRDYGRLLKDGEVKLRKPFEDAKQKCRYIFIFDKVMLMCKSIRGEQYSYKEALILADYKVEDVPTPATSSSSKLIHKDKFIHSWNLVHRQEKSNVYSFFAMTDDIKRKWIEAIQKALDNVCPDTNGLTDHTFTMHTFEKVTSCADCEKLLRGMFFQGYKCTVCDVSVHKSCIPTVHSCGAPNLPPRPPMPPSSPSIVSACSGDEDVLRNSWSDLRKAPFGNLPTTYEHRLRSLFPFSGDRAIGQVSFAANDVIILLSKISSADSSDGGAWWEGRVQRTGEEGLFPAELVEDVDAHLAPYEGACRLSSSQSRMNGSDSYINLSLGEYQWFAGPMDRDSAQAVLEVLPSGTFLVRISPKQRGNYAISLNFNGNVKHMRVFSSGEHYYLSTSKYFRSIVELVKWFEEHSLAESFNGLNITLAIPYKRELANAEPIGVATAMYSFTGNASNLLSLKKGERVAILSKAGEEKGWWKGQIDNRIGYFPLAYVTELPIDCSDAISVRTASPGQTNGTPSPSSNSEMPAEPVLAEQDDPDKENLAFDADTFVL